ncbi:MAG TPA: hypothetical protein VNH15_04855 [Elusimicrobiota bacterium]|nr:hypothetical protein [Elusimicrobiota bacterium]
MTKAPENPTAVCGVRGRVWRVLPAVLLPFFLGACATTFTAVINTPVEPISAQQGLLPLRAAILVSPQDQGYVCRAPIPLGAWLYPFGQNLEQVSLETFRQVFQSVATVQEPGDFTGYDVLIEPHFNQEQTSVQISMTRIVAEVSLDFSVLDRSGVVWRKNFVGRVTTGDSDSDMSRGGQALSEAVRDAASAMYQDFGKPGFLGKVTGQSAPSDAKPSGGAAPWWQQ